jgi:hypothetical protein
MRKGCSNPTNMRTQGQNKVVFRYSLLSKGKALQFEDAKLL